MDDLRDVRVLLVDDDESTRYWVSRVLRREGAAVSEESGADAALATLQAERPQILLADIAMPETDGYTLIRRVRELPADAGGHTPAVALTAYAVTPTLVEASLAAGFNGHLQKPFEPEALVDIVRRLLRPATAV